MSSHLHGRRHCSSRPVESAGFHQNRIPIIGRHRRCLHITPCSWYNLARRKAQLPSFLPHATTTTSDSNALVTTWDGYDNLGPAFQATLGMLEWPKLCEQVARFASTHVGKRACRALLVPEEPAETMRLLEQTRAMTVLEYDWATPPDFGGIRTSEAEAGLGRADKGGMMSPGQLRAVVTLVHGAERLRKQVVAAARANPGGLQPDSPVRVLLAAVGRVRPQPHLVRTISLAVDEEGNLQDSASEPLRIMRLRVKALQSRLAAMLKGYGGEVSERGGRVCVAVPAGTKIPNGVLLGSSAGGSLLFIEPPAVVGVNNELGAARAQAQAAEEAVLWELTGLVMGCLEELQDMYRIVAWLDVLAARARYGMWIGGALPEIVPWDKVFHARGAAAMRRRHTQQDRNTGRGEGQQEESTSVGRDDLDERYAVRLRGLRHPLLYGEYLGRKEALEREVRMNSPSSSSSSASSASSSSYWASSWDGSTAASGGGRGGGGGGGGGGSGQRRRMLSTRKEVLQQQAGLSSSMWSSSTSSISSQSGSEDEGDGGEGDDDPQRQRPPTPQAALAALRPPRPVDWVVRPDTSVVVITGPNTGGKTAAMKALGLAACMARAGLAVPAEEPARLPAFTSVLADIGDEQSLTANLSTFSGHLRRIQSLRAEADGKCLLLLDELGTGTDPGEGAALGLALLRNLVNGGVGSGALTVATTHHSVMTGLKFDDPRVENASVEFDEAALAPTYKLLWGVPGRSNALNIAQRLGLAPSVVSAARSRLDVGVASVNSAIEQLEALRGALEEQERAAWEADRDARSLKRRLQSSWSRVEELRGTLAGARGEALLQVYKLARDRIRRIKEDRRRLGRSAPPPQPILAPQNPQPTTDAPTTNDGTATSTTGDEVQWPSEEEIWEAWEAANGSNGTSDGAASTHGSTSGVTAAAIGSPAAPGSPRPTARAAAPPAVTASASASASAATTTRTSGGSSRGSSSSSNGGSAAAAAAAGKPSIASAPGAAEPGPGSVSVRPSAADDPLRQLLGLAGDLDASSDDSEWELGRLFDSLAARSEALRAPDNKAHGARGQKVTSGAGGGGGGGDDEDEDEEVQLAAALLAAMEGLRGSPGGRGAAETTAPPPPKQQQQALGREQQRQWQQSSQAPRQQQQQQQMSRAAGRTGGSGSGSGGGGRGGMTVEVDAEYLALASVLEESVDELRALQQQQQQRPHGEGNATGSERGGGSSGGGAAGMTREGPGGFDDAEIELAELALSALASPSVQYRQEQQHRQEQQGGQQQQQQQQQGGQQQQRQWRPPAKGHVAKQDEEPPQPQKERQAAKGTRAGAIVWGSKRR